MKSTKGVALPSRNFPTKKAAKDFFRDMLNRYRLGELISHEDTQILDELLDRHPDKNEIGGPLLIGFRVDRSLFNTRCFYAVRVDGSSHDFSIGTAIDCGHPPTDTRVRIGFRAAIQEDIRSFKNSYFAQFGKEGVAPCQETGAVLKLADAHVDHVWPFTFETLVDVYLSARGVAADQILLEWKDGQECVADGDLRSGFVSFHNATAPLLVVAGNINLTRKRRPIHDIARTIDQGF